MGKRTFIGKDDDNSDEVRKEPHVGKKLFLGMRFYISRLVKKEERRELGQLIQRNGGLLSSKSSSTVIELVDPSELKPRRGWVATSFVFDSIESDHLKPIELYQFKPRIYKSPQAKKVRLPYTIKDDARMLQFLTTQKQKWKTMDSVPENFWRLAERHKITAHSAQSMHERFRKKLRGYTPSQVAHALKQASADSDLSSEIEEEYVSVTPIKREKRFISPPRDNKRDENTYSSAESGSDSLQSRVRRKRPDRKRTIESTENSSKESSPSPKTVDILKTRMKYPPVLKKLGQLSSKEQEKMLEQPELRRLLQAAHHLLIENESKKSKKIEATKSKTPTPMKPIERPKRPFAEREVIERVEADSGSIGNIIRQIQFESKQDINAVIHALFYASGDIEMATAFLKGGGHKDMWTSEEDKLLLRKYREATPETISNARQNGDLSNISKSAKAITMRIEYLLKR